MCTTTFITQISISLVYYNISVSLTAVSTVLFLVWVFVTPSTHIKQSERKINSNSELILLLVSIINIIDSNAILIQQTHLI